MKICYHAGLQRCVVSSDTGQYSSNLIEKLKDLYKSLGDQHSSSSAVKRIPLNFLQGDEFRTALGIYIRPLLHQRVPSLFSDLRPLYEQPDKADIIDKVMLELESLIRENNESIPIPLWTLCLLAQHYDRRGRYEIALSQVNEAIKQNEAVAVALGQVNEAIKQNEAVAVALGQVNEAIKQNEAVAELYLVKARILKHTGDLETAASMAEKAKDMDPKNSFTKKKYIKHMLQIDKDVMFTKDKDDQQTSLPNMECMWYELALGDCYYRRGDLGKSLKNYLAVLTYYTKLSEERFDFRSYQSGGLTLHTSVETLRCQERLDPGSYFHKAATGIIRCYMKLYDSSTKLDDEALMSTTVKMPLSKKKMQETTVTRVSNTKNLVDTKARKGVKSHAKELCNKDKETSRSSKYLDPIGAKLLQVENPLLEATKYFNLLQKIHPDSFGTHVLLFELSMRKYDMLEVCKASKNLVRLEEDNPDTLRYLVRFLGRLDSMVLEESVRTALAIPISTLREKSLIKLIEDFLVRNKGSIVHMVAAAEMLFYLQPYKKLPIVNCINETVYDFYLIPSCLDVCIYMHFHFERDLWWITKEFKELFPFPSYFRTLANNDTSSKSEEEVWVFDSGSTRHGCSKISRLLRKREEVGHFSTSSGKIALYTVVGDVLVNSEDCGRSYFLEDVAHFPRGRNIISVRRFVEQHHCLAQFLLRDSRYISMVAREYILARGFTSGNKYKFIEKFPDKKETDSGWFVDSGSSCHTTCDESCLTGIEDCEQIALRDVDGEVTTSSRKGACELTYTENGVTTRFLMKDVYVFTEGVSLLSVSCFTRDNKCSVLFASDQYYILDAEHDMILKPELICGYGTEHIGIYNLR
ncbi:N-terminal acetyltransferase A complex auxiliary subunit NAA15-like [Daucus carota subsp. sativus]|uniref:N-terminal acetyltransferase A complex auxiliary subunit NAA15-like n=1 Tax=Daucus carota subsp. sativus TaxID=79200 RepID=UPI0030828905